MSRFCYAPVYVTVDDTGGDLVLRLQGGPERDSGCVNPSEPIEPFEIDRLLWRSFSLVGSRALAALCRVLADVPDLSPRGVFEPEPTFGFEASPVYDNKLWDAVEWQRIASRLGVARPTSATHWSLRYASLHLWCTLGWPYRESPFELNWEFACRGTVYQRWFEFGYDGADLEVHVCAQQQMKPMSKQDALQRLSLWAHVLGHELFELPAPICLVPFEPYPEPEGAVPVRWRQ